MLGAHGALLSDERLPLAVTDFRETTHIEGRVLGHGQEEYSDRIYLMIEGVEGKSTFPVPDRRNPECTTARTVARELVCADREARIW